MYQCDLTIETLWYGKGPISGSLNITTHHPHGAPALGASCFLRGSSNQYLADDCYALFRWSLNLFIGNLAPKRSKPPSPFASRTNNLMHEVTKEDEEQTR